MLFVELNPEYAIISSPLPSSSVPSILIKPGLEALAADPPIIVWNPLFSAISQLTPVVL